MSENQDSPVLDSPQHPVQQDYFNFSSQRVFTLPDGISEIYFAVMNEGKKAKFQKESQRSLTIKRGTQDAVTSIDPAADRHALISASVTGWNLMRGNAAYPFNARGLADFLNVTDPKIVEDLEKEIRKANPWLLAEMSVEDIDREIASLEELRAAAEERERGEASSAQR